MFFRFTPFAFLLSFIVLLIISLLYTAEWVPVSEIFYYVSLTSIVATILSFFIWHISFDDSKKEEVSVLITVVGFFSLASGLFLFVPVAFSESENAIIKTLKFYFFLPRDMFNSILSYKWVITKYFIFHTAFMMFLVFTTLPFARFTLWRNRKRIEGKHRKVYQYQQAQLQAQQRQNLEQEQIKKQQAEQKRKEVEAQKRQKKAENKAREQERRRTVLEGSIQKTIHHIDTVTAKNNRLTQEIRNLERIVSGLDIFDDDFLDNYPKILQYIGEEYQIGKA